ncbi:hypothetical protein SLEP1_g24480 [Rubroshorea leprosula]|uniref:Uncharacterized protein n=1 Tax=Rubroshorea leprosula TaxID=152421 RepID=A0AAV5JFU2_9ROSI|nr:hypothetical protein SLEP1_g24480 [Rubroshorea leprosula]
MTPNPLLLDPQRWTAMTKMSSFWAGFNRRLSRSSSRKLAVPSFNLDKTEVTFGIIHSLS